MSLEPTRKGAGYIIRQNYISIGAAFLSATILTQETTFGGAQAYDVLVGLALILVGIVFSIALQFFKTDKTFNEARAINTASWGFVALFIFVVTGLIVPQIQTTSLGIVSVQTFYANTQFNLNQQGVLTGAFIFTAILIPNAEEQFFRGAWGNFFLTVFKRDPYIAPFAGGAIFAVFHLAVYGLNYYTLGTLFIDGATMISIDAFGSGNIDSSVMAHMTNNALAFGVAANIISFPGIPQAVLMPLQFTVPIAFAARFMLAKRGYRLW